MIRSAVIDAKTAAAAVYTGLVRILGQAIDAIISAMFGHHTGIAIFHVTPVARIAISHTVASATVITTAAHSRAIGSATSALTVDA